MTDAQSLARYVSIELRQVTTMTTRFLGVSDQTSFAEVITALQMAATIVPLRKSDAAQHVAEIGGSIDLWAIFVAHLVNSIEERTVAYRARRGDNSAPKLMKHNAASEGPLTDYPMTAQSL